MNILADLQQTLDETLPYFALGEADLQRRYGPDKWSVAFILHHLADVEVMELERIHRTLTEKRPTLNRMDADGWAAGLAYDRRPMGPSRELLVAGRGAVMQLARLFYESKGHLEYVHTELGPITLRAEFEKVAEHNAKHLGHIRLALSRVST